LVKDKGSTSVEFRSWSQSWAVSRRWTKP